MLRSGEYDEKDAKLRDIIRKFLIPEQHVKTGCHPKLNLLHRDSFLYALQDHNTLPQSPAGGLQR